MEETGIILGFEKKDKEEYKTSMKFLTELDQNIKYDFSDTSNIEPATISERPGKVTFTYTKANDKVFAGFTNTQENLVELISGNSMNIKDKNQEPACITDIVTLDTVYTLTKDAEMISLINPEKRFQLNQDIKRLHSFLPDKNTAYILTFLEEPKEKYEIYKLTPKLKKLISIDHVVNPNGDVNLQKQNDILVTDVMQSSLIAYKPARNGTNDFRMERLDKTFINNGKYHSFTILPTKQADHLPIIASVQDQEDTNKLIYYNINLLDQQKNTKTQVPIKIEQGYHIEHIGLIKNKALYNTLKENYLS
ncbi:MAG: hypothetical protein ACQESF_04910 [Nanobdellota archaeon]